MSESSACCRCAELSRGAKALNLRQERISRLAGHSRFPATCRAAAVARTAFFWRLEALWTCECYHCRLLHLSSSGSQVVARLLCMSCFHSLCLQSASVLSSLWTMMTLLRWGFHPESFPAWEACSSVITLTLAWRLCKIIFWLWIRSKLGDTAVRSVVYF